TRQNGRWLRVSPEAPCPVCTHADWCTFTADGAIAVCMRVRDGAFKVGTNKNGEEYYVHRLSDEAEGTVPDETDPAEADDPAAAGPNPERADPETLHAVYTALLDGLTLSRKHADQLTRRGLRYDTIKQRGYKSKGWGDVVLVD